MANVLVSALSLERISVAITASVNPTSDVVQIAVVLAGNTPSVWVSATWMTTGGVYYATALIGPGSPIGALAAGQYAVWVKVTDSPEIPVLRALDTITIF